MTGFDFRQCGPECGDCTAPYDIVFYKKYTVREFIQEVLTRKEWGRIGIYNPKENPFFGSPCCEYRHDQLKSHLPENLMDKTIKSASASGGWTLMNYILTLD